MTVRQQIDFWFRLESAVQRTREFGRVNGRDGEASYFIGIMNVILSDLTGIPTEHISNLTSIVNTQRQRLHESDPQSE